MTQGRAPSQKDVAELAGVSSQTVSRVVNNSPRVDEQTRERVLSAMRILGYWTNGAARALATGQSRSFGVISFDLSLYGNARTIKAVAAAAQDAGYSVTIVGISAATEEAVQRAYAQLASQAIDGVVLIEARILDTTTVRLPTSVPIVLADGDSNSNFPAIDADQAAGARSATQHLLDLGHETVWHVAGPQDSYAARRRATAWRDALKSARRQVPPVVFGDWSAESGLAAGRQLAAMKGVGEAGGVTAIFAANDHMALGVLRALHEAGRRVPEEVSVVGFDDVPEASCYLPPLTTVHQDFDEAGRRCVALLLDQISGGLSGRGEISAIQPRLIERASTGPLSSQL
jgi:DNA-binding LacI/PurR family transcriptional regulator